MGNKEVQYTLGMENLNRNSVQEKLLGFFEKYRPVSFKKGELLFRPGDDFNSIYFVKSGYVRLFTNDEDGKEITINVFKPVFYLSLYYAFKGAENRYFFEAMTEVEMWKAPKDEVIKFLGQDRDILFHITMKLLSTIEDLMKHVELTVSGDAYIKVASLIISMAKNNGRSEGKKIYLEFATTHRLIASLTGLSRETASIQIKKLEREGYIQQNKGVIEINDFVKMESDFVRE